MTPFTSARPAPALPPVVYLPNTEEVYAVTGLRTKSDGTADVHLVELSQWNARRTASHLPIARRRWEAHRDPGPEVTRVRDENGCVFRRVERWWWEPEIDTNSSRRPLFHELLWLAGDLSDATPPDSREGG